MFNYLWDNFFESTPDIEVLAFFNFYTAGDANDIMLGNRGLYLMGKFNLCVQAGQILYLW